MAFAPLPISPAQLIHIAATVGTPSYVYDAAGIRGAYRRLDDAFGDRACKVAVGLGQMAQRALQQVLIFVRSSHICPHSIFPLR